MTEETFTPALGRAGPTSAYDRAIRFWTREGRWRPLFVKQIDPRPSERILDVGCGTGTLAVLLKRRMPSCEIVGLDPDPQILELAREKARSAGVAIDFRQGFARDANTLGGTGYDKVVSSLVFHQTPMAEKSVGLRSMAAAAKATGELHVADYAEQRSWLMRRLFRIVQNIDGFENTQANADGALSRLLGEISNDVRIENVVPTPTGAITLFRATLGVD
ncbi:MAG: class I SAM-dependent methyltransferase [Alphaproteobacteria bacterium]|nr:class I SAM-dependent methyltransferase [Alphaproteobacteria bacterium]